MAIEVTGAQLLDDLAITADMPAFTPETRPTDDQALRMLSQSLYDFSHVHKSFGTRFKESTIAVVSGTELYDLPTDFVSLRYLRYTDSGTRRKIRRGDIDDMDRQGNVPTGWQGGRAVYMLMGRNAASLAHQIRFNDPRGAYTVTIGYVPELEVYTTGDVAKAELTQLTDKIMAEGGIDRWIVIDSAIKIWRLEQKDASDLRNMREEVEQRLQAHMIDRDVDEAEVVRNAWDRGEVDDLWGDRR